MKAVILVGGEGTRLRPLTYNTTKAMVPILNRPFLEHVLHYLKRHNIDDIVLALCYQPEQIKDYFGFGDEIGVKLHYALEENPLGTAGAVKNAEEYLNESFFVLNGDVFTRLDLNAMMAFHRERRAKITIALTPVQDPTIYGLVETDDGGRIQRFLEKPRRDQVTTNMINAGIYILEPDVLSYIPQQTRFMFEHDVFPTLLERGLPLFGYPTDDYWIDIGSPDKYLRLNHDLLLGRCVIDLPLPALEASSIHPSAQIKEPVIIGENSTIAPGASIQGPTVIGPGCSIGREATVECSVLWSKVQVGARAVLRNCIIADNCSIGDGACIGNGSVLSDNVTVSQGSKLEPGTMVWPGAKIGDEAGDMRQAGAR